MPGTKEMRSLWAAYRCEPGAVPIEMFGRYAGTTHNVCVDGFTAWAAALAATGYRDVESLWIPRECPTGIGGEECEADGDNCSLHNYRIAVDVDPYGYGNPHFQAPFGDGWDFSDCKLTKKQVDAVERIRNIWGEPMFRWLGWAIGDTMHFEFQVAPDRTAVDWTTVPGGIMEHTHTPMPDELPRDWADGSWEKWVEDTGTDPASRTWTFYREDLSWVYGRVIWPLIRRVETLLGILSTQSLEITALKKRVAALEAAPDRGLTRAEVIELIESSKVRVP